MQSINYDTGVREYALNGDESNTIKIMISDLNLIVRINDMQEKLSDIAAGFEDMTANQVMEMDSAVRELINTAFGTDVCTAAFGKVNCCSVLEGGKLLFEGFVESLSALVRSEIEAMDIERKPRPEVQRYLE